MLTKLKLLSAAWIGGEDGPKAFMVAATSDDNGETWSKPRLVIDSLSSSLPLPRSVIIGNFWTDPNGKLWLFFDQTMNHYDGRQGVWVITCKNPDAEKPLWSVNVYISYDRNRAKDGEILMARFTENDILAKALVTPGSKIKMLISRPLKNRKK
ncbi:MAG: sialidase family protein [Kiritimatiellae bacterium]|jgi:hypothetical protein|nr:sialidase family protein [Kiritimatiellia bacterium]